jgi:hypothetical protein
MTVAEACLGCDLDALLVSVPIYGTRVGRLHRDMVEEQGAQI